MSKLNKSLVNDTVAVACHQTQEVEFLRAALQVIHAAATSGLAASGHPTCSFIQSLCDEARQSTGGAA